MTWHIIGAACLGMGAGVLGACILFGWMLDAQESRRKSERDTEPCPGPNAGSQCVVLEFPSDGHITGRLRRETMPDPDWEDGHG